MSESLSLKIDAGPDALERILDAVEEFGVQEDWEPGLLFRVKLVLEELGLNVIDHGSGDETPDIEITVISEPDVLEINISDNGLPFDPLNDAPPPDLTSSIEKRPIGGLGIHLVLTMMDEIRYRRENGRNHLALIKRKSG